MSAAVPEDPLSSLAPLLRVRLVLDDLCRSEGSGARRTKRKVRDALTSKSGGPLGRLAENPTAIPKLVLPVFKAADDRGTISRPDVVTRFQVCGRFWPVNRNPRLTEGREILTVGILLP
jgi:hypothetical protein